MWLASTQVILLQQPAVCCNTDLWFEVILNLGCVYII